MSRTSLKIRLKQQAELMRAANVFHTFYGMFVDLTMTAPYIQRMSDEVAVNNVLRTLKKLEAQLSELTVTVAMRIGMAIDDEEAKSASRTKKSRMMRDVDSALGTIRAELLRQIEKSPAATEAIASLADQGSFDDLQNESSYNAILLSGRKLDKFSRDYLRKNKGKLRHPIAPLADIGAIVVMAMRDIRNRGTVRLAGAK